MMVEKSAEQFFRIRLHFLRQILLNGFLGSLLRLLRANTFLAAWFPIMVCSMLTWIRLNWAGGWTVHATRIPVLLMLIVLNSGIPTKIMKWYIYATAIEASKEMDFQRVSDAKMVNKCHAFLDLVFQFNFASLQFCTLGWSILVVQRFGEHGFCKPWQDFNSGRRNLQ